MTSSRDLEMDNLDVVFTRDNGEFWGGKICECQRCKEKSICTPSNDFYVLADDPEMLLYCEDCYLVQYAENEGEKILQVKGSIVVDKGEIERRGSHEQG